MAERRAAAKNHFTIASNRSSRVVPKSSKAARGPSPGQSCCESVFDFKIKILLNYIKYIILKKKLKNPTREERLRVKIL